MITDGSEYDVETEVFLDDGGTPPPPAGTFDTTFDGSFS